MSLQVFESLLLLLILLVLLLPFLREHFLEHGVVALVVEELLLVQVDDLVADVVEEGLVVGDHQEGFLPALEVAGIGLNVLIWSNDHFCRQQSNTL